MADEGNLEWLIELLQEVQLEQFLSRIRDDLQVKQILCKLKKRALSRVEDLFNL